MNLQPMPACLKAAVYEEMPMSFAQGGFETPLPWTASEHRCPDCRAERITVFGNHICPKCVLVSRFVKRSRNLLSKAIRSHRKARTATKLDEVLVTSAELPDAMIYPLDPAPLTHRTDWDPILNTWIVMPIDEQPWSVQ